MIAAIVDWLLRIYARLGYRPAKFRIMGAPYPYACPSPDFPFFARGIWDSSFRGHGVWHSCYRSKSACHSRGCGGCRVND